MYKQLIIIDIIVCIWVFFSHSLYLSLSLSISLLLSLLYGLYNRLKTIPNMFFRIIIKKAVHQRYGKLHEIDFEWWWKCNPKTNQSTYLLTCTIFSKLRISYVQRLLCSIKKAKLKVLIILNSFVNTTNGFLQQ